MSDPATNMEDTRPTMLLIAGFGDNASMFDGLSDTPLARAYRLVPINLPGFGAPPLQSTTTLKALGSVVAEIARDTGATFIVAHSVASIVASLAATEPACPLTTIISLEGNITADDAYFSGTAAEYDDPMAFRAAFLSRLDEMARTAPVISRYREAVAEAHPTALWQLGTDARTFSADHVPGDVLASAARAIYLYNPTNCPESTLAWLDTHPMERILLDDASHWPTVDRPDLVADVILKALA